METKLDQSDLQVGRFCKTRSKSFIVVDRSCITLPRRPHMGELDHRSVETITVFYVAHRRDSLHQKLKTYSLGSFMQYLGRPSSECFYS